MISLIKPNKTVFFRHKQQLQILLQTDISGKNIPIKSPPYCCLFFLILMLLPSFIALQAGTSWRLSAESGFYRRNPIEDGKSLQFVSRLNGYLTFQNRSKSNVWWLSLRLKPEFYQDAIGYTAIKLINKGQYIHHNSKMSLGMGFDIRRYMYMNTPENITLDLFELSGILSYRLTRKYQLIWYPAYYYQDIVDYLNQKLDALKTKIFLSRAFHNQISMSVGIYLEHFSVQSQSNASALLAHERNRGYRFGPEIYFEQNQIFYFTARYSFLWHQSEITRDPSHEQYIRLLFGKVVLSNLTVLCLFDYYWNNLTIVNDLETPAVYIPFDTENRIDLKIERPFNKHLIYYIRGGYFKDDFALQKFTARGWQFLIGFDYSQ
jgi:hypothetical protein